MTRYGAVSVAGYDKDGNEKPNQDATFCQHSSFGVCAIVADGAGSAKYGKISSNFLIKSISREMRVLSEFRDLEEFKNFIISRIEYVRNVFARSIKVNRLNCDLNEFSTTLLGCFKNDSKTYVVHIGDGACLVYDEHENLKFSSLPENGEYINETHFITDQNWHDHIRFYEIQDSVSSLLVMTDGVTPFALSGNQPFSKFTIPLIRFLKTASSENAHSSIKDMLTSKTARDISVDDKSIVWWAK